jgi:hypothetical protein
MIRLSELYMERKRDAPLPPDVDLDAVVAESVAPPIDEPKEEGGDRAASLRATATKSVAHVWRRQAGIARRVLGELALWPADPLRARDAAEGVVGGVRTTVTKCAEVATSLAAPIVEGSRAGVTAGSASTSNRPGAGKMSADR